MIGNKTLEALFEKYETTIELLNDIIPDYAWENNNYHSEAISKLDKEIKDMKVRILYFKEKGK